MSDPHTLLIVEDDPEFTSYLKRLLRNKDLNILTASSGRQSIQCLTANSVDLVLQDIGLPDINGYQVMEHVHKTYPEALVIVMTGEVTVESAIQALRHGAYDYLRKPFETTELINTVDNALDRIKLERRHKEARKKLRESEERYRQLFNNESDAVVVFDAASMQFEDVNRAALKLFGYSKTEFLDLGVLDISAEKDKTKKFIRCLTNEKLSKNYVPLRYLVKKDGITFLAEISAGAFVADGHKKILGTIRDITDIKQTEEALRKSEQQFRDLIENSPVCITIIQNGRVVYENPELKKIYSLASENHLLKFLDYVHPDDMEKVKQAHAIIVSDETDNVETDFRFHPPTGEDNKSEMRWFQCRGTRFQYQGREALLLNAVDITETKQLEHQLLIKNKMLSLGRVAAGIAHEIRNPLTGINTYLYTIEDLCDSDQLGGEDMEIIRQVITQIQVASNKIESVIKRVMDFSKPGAPKMVRTDINASLEEAIELSLVTMRKNGIKIEKSLATNLPQCYADPQLIEQVVLNLITNAARAMEKSNGNPKLVQIKSAALNNTLRIQVADSGPGVPVELHEKIFDPFFTTKEDGAGIGLNIAQRIVADHNGAITLGNSRWGGAEFTIELPIERRMNTR